MKITEKEGGKIDVSFRLAIRSPGIMSPADEINNILLEVGSAEFEDAKFDNLDSWLLENELFKQYIEHLDKRITKTAPRPGIF